MELEECQAQRDAECQQREQMREQAQGLEVALDEQKEQLRRLQHEREELMSSQDVLKTDADAMRIEVQMFMKEERQQELERQRALEIGLEKLEMMSIHLSDCMTKTNHKTDKSYLEAVRQRTTMMAQVAKLHDQLVALQGRYKRQSGDLQKAEDCLSVTLGKLEAATSRHESIRAEMEADAMKVNVQADTYLVAIADIRRATTI